MICQGKIAKKITKKYFLTSCIFVIIFVNKSKVAGKVIGMDKLGPLGLIVIIAIIIAGCYIIIPAACKAYKIERAIRMQPTEEERIEIRKKLKKHGLDKHVPVVYISYRGEEWFERNGKRCKF